ncbi:MAG TPA: DoxX family protein [Gaiellales bacterium]
MEDRPSIPIALMRVVVGAAFLAAAFEKLSDHVQSTSDFDRWGLPDPSTFSYAISGVEIVFGVILILGILPRFAALVLLGDMVGALLTAGRIDGGPHLILPPLLGVLCLILLITGGGRWALVDRIDPAPPRQLIRSR